MNRPDLINILYELSVVLFVKQAVLIRVNMMLHEKLAKAFFVILLPLALNGCAASLSPIEVSERFWTAVQHGNTGVVRKYVTSESMNRNDLTEDILPLDSFSLGKTVIDGQQAWVDTTVVISADKPFSLPLKTILLQENEQWKVDYDATVASVSRGSDVARIIGSIASISEQFASELDRSLAEIQKSLPEVQKELERIEKDIKEKLPELRRRMEEFMRQLEEALKGIGKKREQPGTTEI